MIPDLHTNPTNVVSHLVTGPVVKICHHAGASYPLSFLRHIYSISDNIVTIL